MIARLSRNDPVIAEVMQWTVHGWPPKVPDELIWGAWVVVPPKARKVVLDILHDTHQGISATKAKARAYVWWPVMDRDIEGMCKACQSCGLHQHRPQTVTPGAWPVHIVHMVEALCGSCWPLPRSHFSAGG